MIKVDIRKNIFVNKYLVISLMSLYLGSIACAKDCERVFPEDLDEAQRYFEAASIDFKEGTKTQNQ